MKYGSKQEPKLVEQDTVEIQTIKAQLFTKQAAFQLFIKLIMSQSFVLICFE